MITSNNNENYKTRDNKNYPEKLSLSKANKTSFISASKITKSIDISANTLRRWSAQGKLDYIRTNNGTGKRLYNIETVNNILGFQSNQTVKQRQTVLYARVSSNHQKMDLDRQVETLLENFPNETVYKDICSGINWNRKGFKTILEQVLQGNIERIVVTYKDRLCRFGFELVEWICKQFNTSILVLYPSANTDGYASELSEDLLSIVTVFVAKNNGRRAGKYRKERKEKAKLQEKSKEE